MIENIGMLKFYEVPGNSLLLSPEDLVAQQFRKAKNFNHDILNTVMVTNNMLPGFAFKRLSDGYIYDTPYPYTSVGSTFNLCDLDGNVVAKLPNAIIRVINSGGYEYFYKEITHGYNQNNTDGNAILDAATYLQNHKQWEVPCGYYYYQITMTHPSGTQEKTYTSEIFRVVEAELIKQENLVLNPDFAGYLSSWVIGGGAWTFTPGQATLTALSGGVADLHQTFNQSFDFMVVEFTVSGLSLSPGGYMRVFTSPLPADQYHQEIRVVANGTYQLYVRKSHTLFIKSSNALFTISNISIRNYNYFQDYVVIATKNLCRGANALPDTKAYIDYTLMDGRILQPKYGEDIVQEENGDFEKSTSFCRAYKIYDFSPTQLPEFMIDWLAKLNTYDIVGLYDSIDKSSYANVLGFDKLVTNFKLANEWIGTDSYGLVNLSFEETLALKSNCCDIIEECECDDEFNPQIAVEIASGGTAHKDYKITPSSDFADCMWVELFVAEADTNDIDCDTAEFTSTGIVVSGSSFNADGITFNSAVAKYRCFYVKLRQNGCNFVTDTSNHVKLDNCDPLGFTIEYYTEGIDPTAHYFIKTSGTPLPTGLTVEIWAYFSPLASACSGTKTLFSTITSDDLNSGYDFFLKSIFIRTAVVIAKLKAYDCKPDSDSNDLCIDVL